MPDRNHSDPGAYRRHERTALTSSWGSFVDMDTRNDIVNFGIWYDRWTPGDTTGNNIYVAYAARVTDVLYFDYLDTSTDLQAWPGATRDTIAALGGQNPDDGKASITRATDGDLYVAAAGSTLQDVWRSTDLGATAWTLTTGTDPLNNSFEQSSLMPLPDGDILITYLDCVSCSGSIPGTYNIRSQIYDDDGTPTWVGASDTLVSSITLSSIDWAPYWGASINKTTGDIYLAISNNPYNTGGGADIETHFYDESLGTWTQKTDVITNSVDGLTDAAITIDECNGDIYAVYG